MLQDAIICLLHTFEIFVNEDFPPNRAHTFQPPQTNVGLANQATHYPLGHLVNCVLS